MWPRNCRIALPVFAAITLLGVISCNGYKNFVSLQKSETAPSPPIAITDDGRPLYPNGLSWLFEQNALQYGQKPGEIRSNLKSVEPMCGTHFDLAQTSNPWVLPLPETFHGSKTFTGHYSEILEILPTGTYVLAAMVFDPENKAAFVYSKGAFDIPYLTCLPGDRETIDDVRKSQPVERLATLDKWCDIESEFLISLKRVRTKHDFIQVCERNLENAMPGSWILKVRPFVADASYVDWAVTDNLICMRKHFKAEQVMVLSVDDGFDGSFFPMFNSTKKKWPHMDAVAVYLVDDRVTAISMSRQSIKVLPLTDPSDFRFTFSRNVRFWRVAADGDLSGQDDTPRRH